MSPGRRCAAALALVCALAGCGGGIKEGVDLSDIENSPAMKQQEAMRRLGENKGKLPGARGARSSRAGGR